MSDHFLKDVAFKDDLVATAAGDLDTAEGLTNVKEALFRRLITSPGGIIHRPDYGVGIKKYLGAINSLDVRRRLALEIQEQFLQDERVEEITGISFDSDDDYTGMVTITVRVKLVGYDEQSLTFVPFNEV
jgi:hypothetical protein